MFLESTWENLCSSCRSGFTSIYLNFPAIHTAPSLPKCGRTRSPFTFKKYIGATLPQNPLFNQLKVNLCLDLAPPRNRLHPGPKTIGPKLFGSLWVSCSFCVSFSLFLSLFLIDTIEENTKKTGG